MKLVKNIYNHFEEYAAVFLIAVMISCLTAQVLIRVTIGSSLAWTEELSRFSFIWAVYIGMALAAKRGNHIRITAQFLNLSTTNRLKIRILSDSIWILGCIYVAYQGAIIIEENFMFPELSATMGIVKAWVELIIPFSFALVAVRIVESYYTHYKNNTLYSLVQYEEEA